MQKLITISIFEGFFSVQTAMVCELIICANLFELENKVDELLQTNDDIIIFLFYKSEHFPEYQKVFNKYRPSEKVIRCLVFEKFDKKFVQKHQFSQDSVDYYFSTPLTVQMIKEIKENIEVIQKIQSKKNSPEGDKVLSDKERQNLMEAFIEADHLESKTRANFEIPKQNSLDTDKLKKIIDSHLVQLDAYKMDVKIQAIQNLFDEVKDIAYQKNSTKQIEDELDDNRTVVISANSINSINTINQNQIENKGDVMTNSIKNEDSTSMGISFSVLEEESKANSDEESNQQTQTMVMKRPEKNQLPITTDTTQPTHNGLVIDDDENYSLDAEITVHSNSDKSSGGLRLDVAPTDDMEFELNPSSTKSSFTQTDELKIDTQTNSDIGLSLNGDDELSIGDDIGSVDLLDDEIPSFEHDDLIDDDMPAPPPIKNKSKTNAAIKVVEVEEDDDIFSLARNEEESDSKNTYESYKQSVESDDIVVDSGRSLGVLRAMKEERALLLQEIKQLKKENEFLKSENITLASEFEEMKIEKEILRKRAEEKISHLEYKLTVSEDKKILLEAKSKEQAHEIKILRQGGHIDGQNLRKREKELEQKLEMLKIDSESQVHSRDKKILDLKRKLDALEFNMESMSSKEQQLREEKSLLEDKVNKIMKVLRKSIDDIDTESEVRDNEILKRLKRA